MIDGTAVTLVDMPGFDDTDIPDATIFTLTAEWLRKSYTEDRKLNGILYLYNIDDVRMKGSARKNLLMFSDLCGDTFLKDAIFVTTFWSDDPSKHQQQLQHLTQLETNPAFWKPMIDAGAKVEKFDPKTDDRALVIVRALMKQPALPTKIQEEMVDENKDINATTAGSRVNEELVQAKAQFQAELSALETKLNQTTDANMKKIYQLEMSLAEERVAKAAQNQDLMDKFSTQLEANRKLQQQIADSNQPSKPSSATDLIKAVRARNVDDVRRLANQGTDINSSNKSGKTALMIAARLGEAEMVRILLTRGASAKTQDDAGDTALHKAARKGNRLVVERLTKGMNSLEIKHNEGRTALLTACHHGHTGTVSTLLEAGSSIRSADDNGYTALHWAAAEGHKEIARLLLDNGASVKATNSSGRTPRRVAGKADHTNTAALIAKYE